MSSPGAERFPSTILWLILLVTLACLVYEVWAALSEHAYPTITEAVTLLYTRYPVLCFLAGFLAGHLFWPNRDP